MLSNIHGYEIDSIEFISMLKISQTLDDDIEYVKIINILGHTFYQHLRIDSLQKCNITYDRINLNDIKRIKTRSYAKVPTFTTIDNTKQIRVLPKTISFETYEIK